MLCACLATQAHGHYRHIAVTLPLQYRYVATQARERVNTLSKRLHHLRSTAACAGIYNSAYHVGHHPTAFGVPVEQHLRAAIRPMIKAELAHRQRNIGPLPPLSPINPHRTEMSYDFVEQQACNHVY